MIPPVIMEVRARAGEAAAVVEAESRAVVASLRQASIAAERQAVQAEAASVRAAARAERLSARAATQTGEAAAATARTAEEAALQANRAAEAATRARAEADRAAAEVRSASAGAAAGAAQLNRTAKAAFAGTAAAAALVGYEGVKMAGNFQQSMTLLQTGAGELKSNLDLVGKGILAMAGEVGTSAEEIAKHMYTVESAGYHGADGLKVLQAAEEGAKTDGADAAVVADALTTVMKDMHAPASQAADVMSKMVTAVGQGKMRMDDFAGSIHSVLPNAAALHIEFAQVAGALATMTAQGMSADQSAQNLNHTIVKLAAPTTAMTTAMASYGLNAADVAKDLGKNGLTGTMDMLVNAITTHMGPAGLTLRSAFNQSKAAAGDAKRMFDSLPASAQNLAKEFQSGKVTMGEFTKSVKGLDPASANLIKQWAAMENRAHGFSDALKSGGQDSQTFTAALKSMLGDQTGLQVALHLTGKATGDFNNAVKTISNAVPEASGHVKDWKEVNENFNQTIAKLKAGFQSFLIEIGQHLIPIIMAVIGFFEHHTTTAKVLAAVILGSVVAFATLGAVMWANTAATKAWAFATATARGESMLAQIAIKAWTAAQWLWNAAMDANPIGLVIIAIAALVAGFIYAYTHSETFRNVVQAAMHGVVVAFQWVWDKMQQFGSWLASVFGPVISAFVDAWNLNWKIMSAVVSGAWSFIKVLFQAIWIGMTPIRIAVAVLVAAFKIQWALIVDAVKIAWFLIKGYFDLWVKYVGGPLVSMLTTLWGWARTVFSAIAHVVSAMWSAVYPILRAVVVSGFNYIVSGIHMMQSAWNTTWNAVKSVLVGAWNFIKPILDKIGSAINTVSGAIDRVIGGITSAGNAASGFLSHIPGLAGGTDNWGGGVTWVGENGPELLWLPPHSAVTPNRESLRMSAVGAGRAGGGGGAGAPSTALAQVTVVMEGQAVYRANQVVTLQYDKRNGFNGLSPR